MSAVSEVFLSWCLAAAIAAPAKTAPVEPAPAETAPPVEPTAEPEPSETPPETPDAPEGDPESRRAAAAAEFLEGSKYYELGQYPKAIEKFERAWELSNEPLLLFNLGQANWKWFDVDPDPEHLRRAKQSFENYDKRMRGSEGYDPTEIQRFVERIDEQIAKAVETADQRKERELRALEESERRRLWIERERSIVNNLNSSGIALITVGSLTLVMGIAGALVRTANKIVLDQSSGGARMVNLSSAEEDRKRRDQFLLGGQLAFSGFIIGGVLLPVGIALKVTGGVRERRALGRREGPPKAEVAITHDGFKVSF